MTPAIRSVQDLLEAARAGRRSTFLLFWGHHARSQGQTEKACLSQWWEAPFTLEEVAYPTAEHFMMAQKARLFGDKDALERILKARSPAQAKALGRQVKGFEEAVWEAQRFDLVVAGNLAKFSQHRALEAFLLGTGGRVLVEASPLDRIWGIGLAQDDPRALEPEQWRGLNLLGFALMEVRQRLASGS